MDDIRSFTSEDDVRLFYRRLRVGEKRQALIVPLHGVASNMTRWAEFLEHTTLKQDWDILCPDLRGHGRSHYRGRLTARRWSEDLRELLDHEGYEQALIIGHSLGAQVALHFAHRYPRRVSALVLIDPIFGEASHGITSWGRRLWFVLWAAAFAVRTLNALGLHRRHIPPRDLRALDERARAALLDAGKAEDFVKHYSSPSADLRHFPTANFLQELLVMVRPLPPLASITAPVLVVLSKAVTYSDPAVTQKLIANFREAETVVIDAYHWPLTERPNEVRQAIERWCASLKGRLTARPN